LLVGRVGDHRVLVEIGLSLVNATGGLRAVALMPAHQRLLLHRLVAEVARDHLGVEIVQLGPIVNLGSVFDIKRMRV
jgi:hypothetical protein